MISKHILALHLASVTDAYAIPPRSWWDEHMPHGMALFTEELGMDPSDGSGKDYSAWEGGVMARLNVGYPPSMPDRTDFARAAERFGRFVAASRGCRHWVLPNEANHPQEWASGPQYPEDVADWYHVVRKAIWAHAGSGHEVVLGAVAPYCAEVKYPGNERGDWVTYQVDVLRLLQAKHGETPDGVAIHAYARGAHPAAIADRMPMDSPAFADRSCSFQTYRDLLLALPEPLWGVPAYVTEFDEIDAWLDLDTGIVEAAAAEVASWNRERGSRNVIRKLCLYRWCCDRWSIQDKRNLYMDIASAAARGDKWTEGEGPMAEEWSPVYSNRCERGFHDQGGKPEFTIPDGFELYYLHNPACPTECNEPEADLKDAERHPEVYEGRYSAVVYYSFSTGSCWLVSEPVFVQNRRLLRAKAMYMHVFENAGGGARCGLTDGDGPFLGEHTFPPEQRGAIEAAVTWGCWRAIYDPTPQRQWVELATPQFVPTAGHVRVVVQFVLNEAGFGAGHFDAFRIEQLVDGDPTPTPPGDFDWAIHRQIVREELDATRLGT